MAGTLIIFDTDCVLCSKWVHFILAHERDHVIKFVSAWSSHGLSMAAEFGLDEKAFHETYLVVENGRGLTRSDAGFALVSHLKPPYCWLRILMFVPRPLRDAIYSLVARNRYQWFGREPRCFVPPAEMAHRFISN